MKLLVKENISLFLSFAIMNIAGYDKDNDMPLHPIRLKVRNDLLRLKNEPQVKEIRKLLQKQKTYPSWMTYLSIYSTSGFEKIMPERRVLNYDYYKYALEIKDLILELNQNHQLILYYENEIKTLYKKIIVQTQFELSNLPLDNCVSDFWQFKFSDRGIVYINPLDACYQAGGGKKGKTLITVPGPTDFDEEKKLVYYKGISVLGNLFHEFSHSYAKRVGNLVYSKYDELTWNKLERIYYKIINSLETETRNDMLNSYNNWRVYFEESFVKIAESSFISPDAFKTIWTKKQIDWYKDNAIKRETRNGFILIKLIAEEIQSAKEHKEKIESAWEKSIIRVLEDYKSV